MQKLKSLAYLKKLRQYPLLFLPSSIFGEYYLKKHKREQLHIICSNKMRELARFLIEFHKISNMPNAALKDVLTPRLFDMVIESCKNVGGYVKKEET
nr:unnamed protein product [Callosobruchus chinensis]